MTSPATELTPNEIEKILSQHRAKTGSAGFLNKLGASKRPTGEEAEAILAPYRQKKSDQIRERMIEADLGQSITAPVPDIFRTRPITIVVLGTKGGTGKTVTTTLFSKTAAAIRQKNVTIVNADPSVGSNLSRRVLGLSRQAQVEDNPTSPSISNMAANYEAISSGAMRADQFLQEAQGEIVNVLPTDNSPEKVSAYDEQTLSQVLDALKNYSSIVVVDNGAEATNKFALAGLNQADAVIIVTDNTDDSHDGLDRVCRFIKDRFPALVDTSMVVVNRKSVTPRGFTPEGVRATDTVSIAKVAETYGISSHVEIPFDPNIVGGKIILKNLSPKTQLAGKRLVATALDLIRADSIE